MLEFSSREEIWPAVGVVGAEDVEIGFYFLVGLLCLSISLGVVGSRESDIILE